MSDEGFLSRWSRTKHASAADAAGATADAVPAQAAASASPSSPLPRAESSTPALPPVESLTAESDFAPFLAKGVEEQVRRRALKTLFQDPRFNIMDGLDVYIDDYSKPDPLPEGWLEKMNQMARLGEYREPDPEAEKAAAPDEQPTPDAPPEEPPSRIAETAADAPPEGAAPVDTVARDSLGEPRSFP
jgi:hypothetical protein